MSFRISPVHKKIAIAILAGVLLCLVWLVLIRMVLVKNTAVHYHANFGVFINNERLKFEGPTFYEEIASCGNDGADNPRTRGHMHDNIDYVVHVHDNAVTWGHFFANLRYGLSDKSLALDDKVLVDGVDGNKLSFVLNGESITNIANRTIGSEDVLLVSYGQPTEKAELDKQYQTITKDAGEYNKRADPSACTGSKPLTIQDRFKRAIELNPEP